MSQKHRQTEKIKPFPYILPIISIINNKMQQYQNIKIICQFFNHFQYTPFMISKYTFRILNNFTRLIKPRLSKNQTIFELMKDRTNQLTIIEHTNQKNLTFNKLLQPQQVIAKNLGISQKIGKEILNTTVHSYVYSTINMKAYRISQKINKKIQIQQPTDQIQIPYEPNHKNLKYHYSINKKIPTIYQYKINKQTAYIFNIPHEIDQKQLLMDIGYQSVKNLKIHYCMLGLPAFVQVQFISENKFKEKIGNKELEVKIGDRVCRLSTDVQEERMRVNRRQLVIKGFQKFQTPVSVLQKLSMYGRVMNLDYPMQVYREPSIKQIKQLYKNQKWPVCINYHRKNGTIQSQYYPPFQPLRLPTTIVQQKQQQYNRRLKYAQNIHLYEGEASKIKTIPKGYAIVTFSCQQQAQNCYLQLGQYFKMQLLQGRDQFQFDQKHRQALLRFIDNSYIQKSLDKNPNKTHDQNQKMKNTLYFKSLYVRLTLQKYYNNAYYGLNNKSKGQTAEKRHQEYRQHLNQLKQTVGIGNCNKTYNTDNRYGKSLDQLVEEQLYGMKLKQQSINPRYQVNIDDYIRQQRAFIPRQNYTNPIQQAKKDRYLKRDKKKQQDTSKLQQQIVPQQKVQKILAQPIISKSIENKVDGQQIGKHNFSTYKLIQQKIYRQKTQQQIIKSHMNYNTYVRDIINQYMGIFSIQKLQSQLYRRKPKFINPQSLKFSDGRQFLRQQDVKNVLQYSLNIQNAQRFYQYFVRQNQIFKSLNYDVQQKILKNFNDNESQALYHYSDVGIIKQQYTYQGNDINTAVQQLNMQSQFGQQYKIVDNQDGSQKIVKIAKIQNIYPIDVLQKIKTATKQKNYSQKQIQAITKYSDYIFNGQPIPSQLAQAFGLEKNTVIDANKLSQQLCMQLGINKKDIEKILNLQNYGPEQLGLDIHNQKKILKARQKRSAKKASDYGRDPSEIKVKDRNGKAVVSKFRQI